MHIARIVFASALLFGVGCMLPEEGDQQLDPTTLEEQIQADEYAIDESVALSGDSSEVAIEGDEELLGDKDQWVCWYCVKDHKDGAKCPKEYCYHGKHKQKDKAKDKAKDACKEEHGKDCALKECKKFD